ncbi:MAG: hypothetical protein LBN94_03390 [Puniceicoccales bacterium]|jgi:hypothetical protein|nr:hypothetical protein [Puniceicoccales bacterium]
MAMNRKGYLLIEIIIGLSIFLLAAAAITQGILVGLKIHQGISARDPNEALIATSLINCFHPINPRNPINAREFSMEFMADSNILEKWEIKSSQSEQSGTSIPKLYALNIHIQKVEPKPEGPQTTYPVFRYFP